MKEDFSKHLSLKTARNILLAAAAASVAYLLYAESYLDIRVQFLIGWSLLGLSIILHRMRTFKKVPWRVVFIFFSGLISLRYLVWRTSETLLYTGPFDLIGMTLLYLAEIYALIIHFLGMFTSIWPLRRAPVPLSEFDRESLPTVDVFIPTYNEPEDVVKITVASAVQMDYPKEKFRVHILDDGGTLNRRNNPATASAAWERHRQMTRLAGELGVNYITREDNSHAKAGNINNALKHTGAELVLILDSDHVPTRDFLQKTVGWFLKDSKLFLVQTPHFFINPTPVEKQLSEFSGIPGENDMFYRVIHLGLDSWNASYFCGSAAVLRRSCLEESGGISGQTITEDAETSFLLHSKGYNSVYVEEPLSCGLSPDTFDDYISQRTRWAQGMTQLLILNNPLFSKGLTLPQRLCYFNSCFFWLFGFSRIIFYLAPAAFLLFGLKIYHATLAQVIVYTVPHVICTFLVMDFLYGRARQPFFSEIYESVQSIFLLPAVVSVMLNPRRPTFKVTPKGKRLEANFLNPLAWSFFPLVLVNVAAIPLAVIKWVHYPLFRDVIIITAAWSVLNILLAVISLGVFWEKKQVRRHHRARATGDARIFASGLGAPIEGRIKDVSLTGIGTEIAPSCALKPGDDVTVEVEDSCRQRYSFPAKVQRYIRTGDKIFCGLEFASDKETYAAAVRYVYGDSRRWADMWEARSEQHGTARQLSAFMRMGALAVKDIFIHLNKTVLTAIRRQVRDISTTAR